MIAFDPVKVTDLIQTVVDEEILPRFRNLSPDDVRVKSSPGDLVTQADTRAELALTSGLTALLPGSRVVGEEAAYADPSVLNELAEEEPVWVIDPVDGTGNFVRGNPQFACIVALVQGGVTRQGWINDCVDKRTWFAAEGKGVFNPDGEPVAFLDSDTSNSDNSLQTLVGQAAGASLRNRLGRYSRRVEWVGSAAHTYLDMLSGAIDFAGFTRLNVWDHAAGVLMVQEAGGIACLANREDYRPTLRKHKSPLVLARSDAVWAEVASHTNRSSV